MLQNGRVPLRQLFTATEVAEMAARGELIIPEAAEVVIEEVVRDPSRPSGPRFGALVHAALMSAGPNAPKQSIARYVAMHARILGATASEADAAAQAVSAALASPLMRRAGGAEEIRRESPVLLRLENGSMVEGVADLAFKADDSWTVVDFKTDRELAPRLDQYRAQLGLYLRGIRKSTECAGIGVLLWL
jgi:ATP-dependent exoDNAse (exonuclease V) beta subunit